VSKSLRRLRFLCIACLSVVGSSAHAVALTPEQQALLNQLSPEQKAMAMQLMQQAGGVIPPPTVSPQPELTPPANRTPTTPGQTPAQGQAPTTPGQCTTVTGQTYTVPPGQACPAAPGQYPTTPGQTCTATTGQTYTIQPGQTCPTTSGQSPTAAPGQTCTNAMGQTYITPPGQTCPITLGQPIPGQPTGQVPTQPALPTPPTPPTYPFTQQTVEQKDQSAVEQLKRFGYDLFTATPSTFTPITDIPIPIDYVIGPGDTIQVQIFGKDNVSYSLLVSREGSINFPGIGPVEVTGMKFSEVKASLIERITHQMIGDRADITMGTLRSIRVLVLGETLQPGSYTVSALSTLTNVLLTSGGIKPIGSLRNIQLKRGSQTVATLDLYDLLLKGDTNSDLRLLQGDVIFVPPVGPTVGIGGAVRRPAIYELKKEKSISDMLNLAGGVLPIAYLRGSQLERIHEGQDRTILNVDLRTPAAQKLPVQDGDVIRVLSALDRFDTIVTLKGHVYRPGQFQWHSGMRLTEIIKSVKDLLPRPDTRYVLIRREMLPDRHIEILSVDLDQALAQTKSSQNLTLSPLDEISVFGLDEDRVAVLGPLIDQLRQQTRVDKPEPVVSIAGQVRYPGNYPFTREMRLADLVQAAVGVLPNSELGFALIRREEKQGQRIDAFSVNIGAALSDPRSSQNIVLKPRDAVQILKIGENRAPALQETIARLELQGGPADPAQVVIVAGQVRSPGEYPLTRGMRLVEALKAAGGVLPGSDLDFAVVRRETDRGQKIEVLSARPRDAFTTPGGPADLPLKPRDQLYVFNLNEDRQLILDPMLTDLRRQAVSSEQARIVEISGAVRKPGTYPLSPGMRVSDLIRASGSLSDGAYTLTAEITRYEVVNAQSRETDHLAVDLAAIYGDDKMSDLLLKPYDRLKIRPVPNWGVQETVEVAGEVRFPGIFSISVGETLSSLLRRAGGLTAHAFPMGTVFMREDLRIREQKQIDDLANRMEMDLASSQLTQTQSDFTPGSSNNAQQSVVIGRQLVQQLRTTKAVGRLVIDLPSLLAGREIAALSEERYNEMDIVLKNGDRLVIPRDTQEVTIIGEVYYPTSHVFRREEDKEDYINRSGGLTPKADSKRIYVVQANGNVSTNANRGVFGWFNEQEIHPGDTIVVPLDSERLQPLAFWSEVSKVVYQIALSAAAFRVVGAF